MNKRKLLLKFFPYILQTIYFNFKFLPFHQAKKLPILLYKPHFVKLNAQITIDSDNVHFGMIQLGKFVNTCNLNNGITFDLDGSIIFKGNAIFANDSYIMIRNGGVLTLGKNLDCNCKIKCAKSIEIGDDTWIAYDSMIMDSDWHALTDVCTGKLLNKVSPVKIGKHNFISFGSTVMKGTITPNFATFTPHSWLNKKYEGDEYSLFGGNPCKLIDEGYYMDHTNN